MNIILLLTEEDIVCNKIGEHIEIKANEVTINLTPGAVKELLSDLTELFI